METAGGGAPISAKNKTFTTTWDFCQLGPKAALQPISSPKVKCSTHDIWNVMHTSVYASTGPCEVTNGQSLAGVPDFMIVKKQKTRERLPNFFFLQISFPHLSQHRWLPLHIQVYSSSYFPATCPKKKFGWCRIDSYITNVDAKSVLPLYLPEGSLACLSLFPCQQVCRDLRLMW